MASCDLTAAQLSALLEGLDWRRVHEARETVGASAAELTCDRVNQVHPNARDARRIMI